MYYTLYLYIYDIITIDMFFCYYTYLLFSPAASAARRAAAVSPKTGLRLPRSKNLKPLGFQIGFLNQTRNLSGFRGGF